MTHRPAVLRRARPSQSLASPPLPPWARRLPLRLLLPLAAALAAGCFAVRPSEGGGQIKLPAMARRHIDPADVALPAGYRIEAVTAGLSLPSAVAFDEAGTPYVVEAGYSYGELFTKPRLLRVAADGSTTEIARGDNGPWTGVAFHDGAFYVAEGGETEGGRITRIGKDGTRTVLIEKLPSYGDHHTNGPVFDGDGNLYFSIGTATNSGVVGPDNFHMGWLKRHPDFHDVPCRDVTVHGVNLKSKNPLVADDHGEVSTGPYQPFGTQVTEGQVVKGSVPCSGAVLRMKATGGEAELVAWGFRNPFGLAFSPDGRLYVSENGYDERGSRPIYGGADWLRAVDKDTWYGWPDYVDGRLVSGRYKTPGPGHDAPTPLLAKYPNEPPKPVAFFGCHSSADGFDFSRSAAFGHEGEAFVALFGDMAAATGKVLAPIGFKVVRADVKRHVVEDFAVNRAGQNGPASRLEKGGLERPVAARFNPDGSALYVVDFGIMAVDGKQIRPVPETGVLWRITRDAGGRP